MKLDDYLKDILDESYSSTITKRGRNQKINTTAGSIGVSLARQKDDPLYTKMMYYKHMYMKTKEQLQRKYHSKALSLARKKATNFKKN